MPAGLAATAAEYPWSSAAAHLTGADPSGILDLEWWQREGIGWAEIVDQDEPESAASLRRCTYAGRPFRSQDFRVRDIKPLRQLLAARASSEEAAPSERQRGAVWVLP